VIPAAPRFTARCRQTPLRIDELVVAIAGKRAVGFERYIGQRVSLQRSREDDRIRGLLLVGDPRQGVDGGVTEPVPRARCFAGPAPEGGEEGEKKRRSRK